MSAIRKHRAIVIALGLLPIVIACSNQSDRAYDQAAMSQASESAVSAAPVAADATHDAAGQVAPKQAGVQAAQVASAVGVSNEANRRFLLTADAKFQVKNVYEAATRIEDMAQSAGGFVIANRISAHSGRAYSRRLGDGTMLELTEFTTTGEVTVRVPAERTQAFLRGLTELMQFLDTRNFEARDMQFELLRRQLAWARNQLLQ